MLVLLQVCIFHTDKHYHFCFLVQSTSSGLAAEKPPNYIVVDIGGGTTDISAYMCKHIDGKSFLDVASRPTGVGCGGKQVNVLFKKFLEQKVGDLNFAKYLSQCSFAERVQRETHLNILFYRTFEEQKLLFGKSHREVDSSYFLKIPPSFIETYERQLLHHVDDGIQLVDKSMVKISADKMRSLFDEVIETSLKSITVELKSIGGQTEALYLVGGFGGCKYVRAKLESMLKNELPSKLMPKKVVTPMKHSNAVVIGAAMYGKDHDVIQARRSAATYGFDVCNIFDPCIHEESYAKYYDNVKHCSNLFSTVVEIDDIIEPDEIFQTTVFPLTKSQTHLTLSICRAYEKDVWYTTGKRGKNSTARHDARIDEIGTLTLELPTYKRGHEREVLVAFDFSSTEIQIKAKEQSTDRFVSAVVDFL